MHNSNMITGLIVYGVAYTYVTYLVHAYDMIHA